MVVFPLLKADTTNFRVPVLNVSSELLPWCKTLTVNSWKASKPVKTVLDTGSGVSLIRRSLVDELKMVPHRVELGIQIVGVGNSVLTLREVVTFQVTVNDSSTAILTAFICDAIPQEFLIGFKDLISLQLIDPTEASSENDDLTCEFEKAGEYALIDSLSVFVGTTTITKAQLLKRLGVQDGERLNDPFDLIDEIDEGITTFDHDGNSSKLQAKEVQLLSEYQDILHLSFKDTITTKKSTGKPKMNIVMKPTFENWSKWTNPFVKDPDQVAILEEEVKQLLEADIIEKSKSDHSYAAFLVKKGEKDHRMVIDYRALNDHTVTEATDLPTIQEMIQSLENKKIFSSMDLLNGYFQMEIEENCRKFTAFSVRSGHYQYKRVPFGLKNAPFAFTNFMRYVLRGIDDVMFYMDDILIASDSIQEHEVKIREVFDRLRLEGVTLKKSKVNLFRSGVKFLGYMVSNKGVGMMNSRTDAIKNIKAPSNVSEARTFMGMANYFRRFVYHFASIANPIHDYIAGKVDWGTDQEVAFETIKEVLSSEPILSQYDPSADIRVTCDASKVAIGAVLEIAVKTNNKIKWHVVEYFSKSLKKAERNYYVGDLEFLAIVTALKKFRYYLIGKQFAVRTDHAPLATYNHHADLNSRLQRQLDSIQEFDFKVEVLKGTENVVADALSRMPTAMRAGVDTFAKTVVCAVTSDVLSEKFIQTKLPISEFTDLYPDDAFCSAVLLCMRDDSSKRLQAHDIPFTAPGLVDRSLFAKYVKQYKSSSILRGALSFVDGVLYYKQKAVVPRDLIPKILDIYHDNPVYGGHSAATTVMLKLKDSFYWKNMSQDVNKYVQKCLNCQVSTRLNHTYGKLMPFEVPKGRFYELSMDFVSGVHASDEDGNDSILVVVDRFTKFVILIPTTKRLTSAELSWMLITKVFTRFGVPVSIMSDNDHLFASANYKELMGRFGIILKTSTTYHPEADGLAERYVQTVISILRKFLHLNSHWSKLLPLVEFNINTTPQRTTKISPFKAAFGFAPRNTEPSVVMSNEPTEAYDIAKEAELIQQLVTENLEYARIEMQVNKNKNIDLLLKPGDLVLVKRDILFSKGQALKLLPLYVGPFRVTHVIGKNTVTVNLPKSSRRSRRVNVRDLKLFYKKDFYKKQAPTNRTEKIQRLHEISQIVGWDAQHVYATMEDVDPEIVVEFERHWIARSGPHLQQKLAAFMQLLKSQKILGNDMLERTPTDGSLPKK